MAVLTTSFNTPFTPTKAVFRVQVNGGARLESRNSASVGFWSPVLTDKLIPETISGIVLVRNDVDGAEYRVVQTHSGSQVAVDE